MSNTNILNKCINCLETFAWLEFDECVTVCSSEGLKCQNTTDIDKGTTIPLICFSPFDICTVKGELMILFNKDQMDDSLKKIIKLMISLLILFCLRNF